MTSNASHSQQQLFTLDHYQEDKYKGFSFFWKSDSPFSQWHISKFTNNGILLNCAEQFMMYEKAMLFGDSVTAQKILETGSPRSQKELGRKVSNFDQATWDKHCIDIVYRGNLAKFSQNKKLKKELLDERHRDHEFVEASPLDTIWGIGLEEGSKATDKKNWRGKNLLGKILTCIRDELLAQEDANNLKSK